MSKRFIVSEPAQRDIRRISQYLLRTAGPIVATKVIREIRAAVRKVAANPSLGHRREDLTSADVWIYTVYSYLIFYRRPKPIEIVRILHGARDLSPLLADELE